jgi:hypothetical protein
VIEVHDVVVDLTALLSSWVMQLEAPMVLSDAGNLILWRRPYSRGADPVGLCVSCPLTILGEPYFT